MLLENLKIGLKEHSDSYDNRVKYRRIDYKTGEVFLYPFWHKPIWVLLVTIEDLLQYYSEEKYNSFISCKLVNYIHDKLL